MKKSVLQKKPVLQKKSVLQVNNQETLKKLLDDIKSKKFHIFVLIHMNGCGACVQSRPNWLSLEKETFHPDVQIVDVEQSMLDKGDELGSIIGYPTFRYFGPENENPENENFEDYEKSSVSPQDRSTESFKKWIDMNSIQTTGKSSIQKGGKKSKTLKKGKTTRKCKPTRKGKTLRKRRRRTIK